MYPIISDTSYLTYLLVKLHIILVILSTIEFNNTISRFSTYSFVIIIVSIPLLLNFIYIYTYTIGIFMKMLELFQIYLINMLLVCLYKQWLEIQYGFGWQISSSFDFGEIFDSYGYIHTYMLHVYALGYCYKGNWSLSNTYHLNYFACYI